MILGITGLSFPLRLRVPEEGNLSVPSKLRALFVWFVRTTWCYFNLFSSCIKGKAHTGISKEMDAYFKCIASVAFVKNKTNRLPESFCMPLFALYSVLLLFDAHRMLCLKWPGLRPRKPSSSKLPQSNCQVLPNLAESLTTFRIFMRPPECDVWCSELEGSVK